MIKYLSLLPWLGMLLLTIWAVWMYVIPKMSAVVKLKLRRLWNGLLGLSMLLLFLAIDFLISASPSLFIKPTNMFENLVCLALFVIIFITVIVISVIWLAKRTESKNKKPHG